MALGGGRLRRGEGGGGGQGDCGLRRDDVLASTPPLGAEDVGGGATTDATCAWLGTGGCWADVGVAEAAIGGGATGGAREEAGVRTGAGGGSMARGGRRRLGAGRRAGQGRRRATNLIFPSRARATDK
nr:WAG22 antigen-like [Aegilops tauschii subsp. strangulata]